MKSFSKRFLGLIGVAFLASGLFIFFTYLDLKPIPQKLIPDISNLNKVRFLDRYGSALSIPYGRALNVQDYIELGSIDDFLKNAFILAEDRRFYTHHGVDWKARLNAVYQNIKSLRVVRGASTITEQVVRILHPRPRTVWSRWLEGIEAAQLEEKFSKEEILEFYLNEVPYSSERRGIVQAARLYFDRDLSSLNHSEMLALATLARAPSDLSSASGSARLKSGAEDLMQMARFKGIAEKTEMLSLDKLEFAKRQNVEQPDVYHFLEFVRKEAEKIPVESSPNKNIVTTLDLPLQKFIRKILNGRLNLLKGKNVRNAAVLVLDHEKNEIVAWVNSDTQNAAQPESFIDAIVTPRQPGSALKPFLYALALEKGWTPATIINDGPIADAVGSGLHSYRNFSRIYYGDVRLRDALANSLNIPAIHAVGFVGVPDFLTYLKKIGLSSLDKSSEFYGEGLALGNGEVSLFELVKAYAVLARKGIKAPVSPIRGQMIREGSLERIISEESSSLISSILSDPTARRLEFGSSGILNFPYQTAVKTGTSSDFRDVWAFGYSGHYTVGVWMGNLDRTATLELTGASGPALVLRSIFHELSKQEFSSGLRLNTKLVTRRICGITGKLAGPKCPVVDEWFNMKNTPLDTCSENHGLKHEPENKSGRPSIMVPTPGLQIAMDPRIPDDYEALLLQLREKSGIEEVRWYIDGEFFKDGKKSDMLWPLQKGKHTVWAETLTKNETEYFVTDQVNFIVK